MSMTEILEKEQKSKPVFKVGDKIKLKSEPKYPYREIVDIRNGSYYFDEAVHLPFDNQDNWEKEQKPAEWSEEDKYTLEDAITAVDMMLTDSFQDSHPNLFKAFLIAKDFLKSLPERFNLQPKQEWSEEDKKMLEGIIERGQAQVRWCDTGLRPEQVTWLKSLRPSWKPSEEDFAELTRIRDSMPNNEWGNQAEGVLDELIENLKKL